jgi:hypothetical protein
MKYVLVLATSSGPHTIVVDLDSPPAQLKAGTDMSVVRIGEGVFVRYGSILALVPADKYQRSR